MVEKVRRHTIEVRIGSKVISSGSPILVQSMLNTDTLDTKACIEQSERIADAGGEMVRITAQGVKEAENIRNIKAGLRADGYDIPLCADIHFMPQAAMTAALYADKVRINPGNFVGGGRAYDESEYARELERIKVKIGELIRICKAGGKALRIGTNHGSLSGRITARFGDTPEGMVEATMEYLRFCKAEDFNNVVISLKSSDCRVMIKAVRLLVCAMEKETMNYPLHLGVTEAGEGEDGRIRSAIGIGTLLNEGIGDTVRVSLTEAPEKEIPVALRLIELTRPAYGRSYSDLCEDGHPAFVVGDISACEVIDDGVTAGLGFDMRDESDPVYGERLVAGTYAPEAVFTEALGPELSKLPGGTKVVVPCDIIDTAHVYNRNAVPLYGSLRYTEDADAWTGAYVEIRDKKDINPALTAKLKADSDAVVVLAPPLDYHIFKEMICRIRREGLTNAVVLKADISSPELSGEEDVYMAVAAHIGGIFADRLASGLWVGAHKKISLRSGLSLSRNIFQSVGLKRYKTEFVSCPGCGRTLFDLQNAVARVKKRFGHLKKLKIAVMGCIVNGPGEMGDADYGYVGAGKGRISLYKKGKLVLKNIPEEDAVEKMEAIIREGGDWE